MQWEKNTGKVHCVLVNYKLLVSMLIYYFFAFQSVISAKSYEIKCI